MTESEHHAYARKARVRLYPWELDSMDEYSLTDPTGQTLFKVWKRDLNAPRRLQHPVTGDMPLNAPRDPDWRVGMYVPDSCCPGYIGILWLRVDLREGPSPRVYHAPDWSNYERYRRVGFGA